MPNLNDFYGFQMSGGDSDGGGSNSGCLRPILIFVMVVGMLSCIGKCCG